MALQIGIVGLPNVGKSTLFNALTRNKSAQAANYPFCTIDPNVGIVEVPDERLDKLAQLVKPEKVIPTVIEFVDIAGLVKGAHKGEGLGNAFLSHIREVDAICQVVRIFEGGDVIHVDGSINPKRDRETIETELILADIQSLDKQTKNLEGKARSGEKDAKKELDILTRIRAALDEGHLASSVVLDEEEQLVVKQFNLLTAKPMIYALNSAEEDLGSLSLDEAKKKAALASDALTILVSAKLEEELIGLSKEEAQQLLSEMNVGASGLDQLIQTAYEALHLLTFFTAGPKEVRAWTVRKGALAPQAAGVIHTDFEHGFICAETVAYEDYIVCGGEQQAKDKGKMRTEGKGYEVKDGDVMHFRFNL